MNPHAAIADLIAAGAIAEIARVGHAPFDIDDPIELRIADGRVFHIDIGFEGATDIIVRESPLLDYAFGHLRTEEPDTFENIARDWTREPIAEVDWVIGHKLTNPRRLTMTVPYVIEVGFVFDVAGRELALFGEADLIHIAALDDAEIESFGLELGAPYSAA